MVVASVIALAGSFIACKDDLVSAGNVDVYPSV